MLYSELSDIISLPSIVWLAIIGLGQNKKLLDGTVSVLSKATTEDSVIVKNVTTAAQVRYVENWCDDIVTTGFTGVT